MIVIIPNLIVQNGVTIVFVILVFVIVRISPINFVNLVSVRVVLVIDHDDFIVIGVVTIYSYEKVNYVTFVGNDYQDYFKDSIICYS